MKRFMDKCYKCGNKVDVAECVKDGIRLNCLRCRRCGEEYFTSSELVKYDIQKGNRKMIRKFGVLGDSTVMRIPPEILKEFRISPGDFGVFESRDDGILIKVVKAKEL